MGLLRLLHLPRRRAPRSRIHTRQRRVHALLVLDHAVRLPYVATQYVPLAVVPAPACVPLARMLPAHLTAAVGMGRCGTARLAHD